MASRPHTFLGGHGVQRASHRQYGEEPDERPKKPASLKGDKGEEGTKGEQGLKGDIGEQGVQGDQGLQGDKGLVGVDGDTGDKGLKGQSGTSGDQGDKGAKGSKGDPGADADSGAKGEQGDEGAKGLRGMDGTPPEKGEKGECADKGQKGEKGVFGESGFPGTDGVKGVKGDTGDKGEKGLPGVDSDKGEKGLKGDKGSPGDDAGSAPGAKGIKGAKGDLGDKGEIGDKGIKGSMGEQGDIGPNGDDALLTTCCGMYTDNVNAVELYMVVLEFIQNGYRKQGSRSQTSQYTIETCEYVSTTDQKRYRTVKVCGNIISTISPTAPGFTQVFEVRYNLATLRGICGIQAIDEKLIEVYHFSCKMNAFGSIEGGEYNSVHFGTGSHIPTMQIGSFPYARSRIVPFPWVEDAPSRSPFCIDFELCFREPVAQIQRTQVLVRSLYSLADPPETDAGPIASPPIVKGGGISANAFTGNTMFDIGSTVDTTTYPDFLQYVVTGIGAGGKGSIPMSDTIGGSGGGSGAYAGLRARSIDTTNAATSTDTVSIFFDTSKTTIDVKNTTVPMMTKGILYVELGAGTDASGSMPGGSGLSSNGGNPNGSNDASQLFIIGNGTSSITSTTTSGEAGGDAFDGFGMYTDQSVIGGTHGSPPPGTKPPTSPYPAGAGSDGINALSNQLPELGGPAVVVVDVLAAKFL